MPLAKPKMFPNKPIITAALGNALLFTVGLVISSWGFCAFLLSNQFYTGGLPGISLILYNLFGIFPSWSQWGIQALCLILSLRVFGYKFTSKSLLGALLLPSFIYLFKGVDPVSADPLLANIFGGVFMGFGIGLIIRAGASTGGVILIAQAIDRYQGYGVSKIIFLLDALVVSAVAAFFTIEVALYAIIGIFAFSRTIDLTITGLNRAKIVLIVSQKEDSIKKAILSELDKGLTCLSASGGFVKDQKQVLMTVINQNDIMPLKSMIQALDPEAFTIVLSASEVMGLGFHHYPKPKS